METKIQKKVVAYLTFHRSPKRTQFGSRVITYASHAHRSRKEYIDIEKFYTLSEFIPQSYLRYNARTVTSILARSHTVLDELLLEAKNLYIGAQAHLVSIFVSEM